MQRFRFNVLYAYRHQMSTLYYANPKNSFSVKIFITYLSPNFLLFYLFLCYFTCRLEDKTVKISYILKDKRRAYSMGYAFISYSTKNQTSADAFKALLDRNNIPNWMAPYNIPIGKNYPEVIIQVLKDCSCLILLLSNDAMHSKYVPREVERAIGYNKPIFPIQLEHVVLNEEFEFYISRNQIVAISKIDESNSTIQQLLTNLRACCTELFTASDVMPHNEYHTASSSASPIIETKSAPVKELPKPPLHVGDIIDHKYRIEKYLAQFDSYHLYISISLKTNKKFFIKTHCQDAGNFRNSTASVETNMLKKTSSPALASLIDIVPYKDLLLTVFDLPEGDFVSELIASKVSFSEEELVHFGTELCDALSYLYTQETQKGFHCVNPGNMICRTSGTLCLLDFYQRTSLPDTNRNNNTNTFFYFAPEVLNGSQDIDCRADIYAIGATLFALATQNDPTQAPYAIYPLYSRRPDLSAGLTHIINKCMETEPVKRYKSFDALLKDLSSVDKLTKKLTQKNFFKELFKK